MMKSPLSPTWLAFCLLQTYFISNSHCQHFGFTLWEQWPGAQPWSMRCVGSLSSLELPGLVWNRDAPLLGAPVFPSLLSAQSLCARPWGNHAGNFININGQCLLAGGQDYEATEVTAFQFERPSAYNLVPNLQNRFEQIQLFCRSRCFCVKETTPSEVKPKSAVGQVDVTMRSRALTYQFSVHKWPNSRGYIPLERSDSRANVPAVFVAGLTGSMIPPPGVSLNDALRDPIFRAGAAAPGTSRTFLNMDPHNKIYCEGEVPSLDFTLPGGFYESDFSSAQEICALQLAGGNKDANAGMYCHPVSRRIRGAGMTEITWSPEIKESLTPRVDWTLRANSRFALRIRSYCLSVCRCRSSEHIADLEPPKSQILADGSVIVEGPGSSWQIGHKSDNGGPRYITISNEEWDRAAKSSPESCADSSGEDLSRFCPDPWPVSLLGPVPKRSFGDFQQLTKVALPVRGVCGLRCSQMSDCNNRGGAEHCKCVVSSTTLAKDSGIDAVFPWAMCATVAVRLTSTRRGASAQWSGPGRRLARREADQARVPTHCVCNATYISMACCDHNNNGLVWEDRLLKLGSLALE